MTMNNKNVMSEKRVFAPFMGGRFFSEWDNQAERRQKRGKIGGREKKISKEIYFVQGLEKEEFNM